MRKRKNPSPDLLLGFELSHPDILSQLLTSFMNYAARESSFVFSDFQFPQGVKEFFDNLHSLASLSVLENLANTKTYEITPEAQREKR